MGLMPRNCDRAGAHQVIAASTDNEPPDDFTRLARRSTGPSSTRRHLASIEARSAVAGCQLVLARKIHGFDIAGVGEHGAKIESICGE